MSSVPFVDCGLPEVVARVAYRLVEREYRRSGSEKPSGVACVNRVVRSLPRNGFPILLTALLGMQYALLQGKATAIQWRNRAGYASKLGYGFRRCFYDDYKANRRR